MFIAETNIYENIFILLTEIDVLSKLNRKEKRFLRIKNSKYTTKGEEPNTVNLPTNELLRQFLRKFLCKY